MFPVISTNIRDLSPFKEFIDTLPRTMRGIAAETIADDLIGTPQRGLKYYPPYRYITRRRAYGKPFKSVRQQRYVMARIREGRIDPGYPHRTGNYQRSWKRTGSGVNVRIEGELPHEGFPNRLAALIRWRDPDAIIQSNEAHAVQAAERAIQREIDRRGYG